MTGYGRASRSVDEKTITIEVRSLNSKFTDVRFKLPQNFREKELELRKIIISKAQRGKIDVSLDVSSPNGHGEYGLNQSLFKKYYQELADLSNVLEMPDSDMMQAILKLPNVVANEEGDISEEEWQAILDALQEALEKFTSFRVTEGAVMESDCRLRINNILEYLQELEPYEAARIVKLRKKLQQNMEEFVGKDNIDANRFEQEILYYLEKIDVTEEKVRLAQHCQYFLEVLDKKNSQKGRKLNFISQEIGREINTLGSKANSSAIQHCVVKMKDELEKIKEQVANSL